MSKKTKNTESTKWTNQPLYTLPNAVLEALNKNPDTWSTGAETYEILKLRRNIDLLSQSKQLPGHPIPIIEDDEVELINFCFSTVYQKSPSFLCLSHQGHSDPKGHGKYPVTFYIGIDDDTTQEDIKRNWAMIKYWRDYIHKAQRSTNPAPGEDLFYDVHTKNMDGHGYGSLAKVLNQTIEHFLRLAVINKQWVEAFEAELQSYLPRNADDTFSNIKLRFSNLYLSKDPEKEIRSIAASFGATQMKCLDSIPKENPYAYYRNVVAALNLLEKLGFKESERNGHINTATEDIARKRTMKKIVTASNVRETLRWWRSKYGYPSPGNTGLG